MARVHAIEICAGSHKRSAPGRKLGKGKRRYSCPAHERSGKGTQPMLATCSKASCERFAAPLIGRALLALACALTATACRASTLDLHTVDWAEASVPGSVCGASHPIQLHRDRAIVASARWRRWRSRPWPAPWPRVTVAAGWKPVVYGDLNRDGHDEAALGVDCNNGGGTAGGVLAYSEVIFTATGNSPHVIGVVTPQQPDTYGVPLVQVRIRPGRIVAHEAWYGPSDGTCCPSGRATTIWTSTSGTLRPRATVIHRKPSA